MEIIVLSITAYKEKDSIVTGLSSDGVHSFLVKGLLSPKSSNIILSSPLVIADVEVSEGNYKYPTVKSSKLIASPYKLDPTLEDMAIINMITEATRVLVQDEEKIILYDMLKGAILALKEQKTDMYQVLLTYLAFILKKTGYEFNVTECVYCGTKNDIVTFSFEEGGFICKKCIDSDTPRIFTTEQMRLIRNIFLTKDYTPFKNVNKEDALFVLNQLAIFIEDGIGIKLKTIKLFI